MVIPLTVTGKFPMGRLVVTAGVNDKMAESTDFCKFIIASMQKYAGADWGQLDVEDRKTNDRALKDGDRILAAYESPNLPKIWIITEWDRSVTTILFPDEY